VPPAEDARGPSERSAEAVMIARARRGRTGAAGRGVTS
jgi:hypothetical protein